MRADTYTMQQPIVLKFRSRRSLRDLFVWRPRSLTPDYSIVSGAAPVSNRADPVLVFPHDDTVPAGDFASEGVCNSQVTSAMVPARGAWWESIEEFALTYDGYAYWSDVAELGNSTMQRWTRDHVLPSTMHELRGCLFYEERRWHHFGEEPSGRGAEYVWALLDAVRTRTTFVATLAPAAPSLPSPPIVPPPPAPAEVEALAEGTAVRVFADDDSGYLGWVQAHQGGFVLNAARGRSVKGLKLHRGSCSAIAGAPSSERSWTKSVRKVCAGDASHLSRWAVETLGTEPETCQRCRP